MRAIISLFIVLLCASFAIANDVNLSTITKDGETQFYLQAGAFALEKNANDRKAELLPLVNNLPVEIKKLSDKGLFLVQVGPIGDYDTAQNLKQTISSNKNQNIQPGTANNTSNSLLAVAQMDPTQQHKTTTPPPRQNSRLWNLRNADIRAVITEVSRVTGKNFIIDPRVQGKVSIVSATPMSNKELYQVFLSVLQVSGYAAIPNGATIKIVPNLDAKTFSPDLLNGLKNPPKGDEVMVAVVPVHYVPAEQLVPVLRPLMPQWSSISAYGPSNMLILSGRANNIKSLADIIKQVDSSTANGIEIVHLQHALAMDVANTLKDLVKTQSGSNTRTPITISADDRSNSILINGNKTDRIRLRMLIMKLDHQSSEGVNNNTQVVYLNYMRAEDMVPILAGIAQANFSGNVGTTIGSVTRPPLDSTNPASSLADNSSSGGGGSSSMFGSDGANSSVGSSAVNSANTTSTTTKNEGSTKPTVQIIGEPNTNSIIINAPASVIRTLKSVINQLDIKPAQLLIEAMVAEVNESNVNDLGIEWGSDQQTGNPKDFRQGFAIINSKTNIDDFQAQIYALAREQKANILSTPSVVVLDNRQAKILVGKQVSVASTTYPNNANGTTPASPYTTFNRVNVALHLYVRPQITRGKGIQMQIDQGNDTLDPSTSSLTNDNLNPTFKISSIVTSVHVESGDIVVLGGLTQDSLGNNDNKIPILGDIPGVGRLFQRNITNRDKRVLMVFIKPIILHREDEGLQVTGEKYNDIRQYQLDWLRSQEVYNESNNETVLPAWKEAKLPKPFSRPIAQNQARTK